MALKRNVSHKASLLLVKRQPGLPRVINPRKNRIVPKHKTDLDRTESFFALKEAKFKIKTKFSPHELDSTHAQMALFISESWCLSTSSYSHFMRCVPKYTVVKLDIRFPISWKNLDHRAP